MAKKWEDDIGLNFEFNISDLNEEDPLNIVVNKSDLAKLTKVAKAWDFTCSFCFKRLPSAQALGGHQNLHKEQRLEEKRRFIKDPITYRKRAFIRAMKVAKRKATGLSSTIKDVTNANPSSDHAHAASRKKVAATKSSVTPKEDLHVLLPGEKVKTTAPLVLLNFLPPKELSLLENVGVVHAKDEKGTTCNGFDVAAGGSSMGMSFEMLDLTLKL